MRPAAPSSSGMETGESKTKASAIAGEKLPAYDAAFTASVFENHGGESSITSLLPSSACPSAPNISMKRRLPIPDRPIAKTSKPVGCDAKSCVGRYGSPQQYSSELP